MSSETAIKLIESIKNKLERYTKSQQNDKVTEYLQKLHNTSMDSSLIQETKIDVIVKQLASNQSASYAKIAKSLYDKLQKAKSSTKSNHEPKVKTERKSNEKTVTTERTSIKRKFPHESTSAEKIANQIKKEPSTTTDETGSGTIKRKKVVSLSEYVHNRKLPTPVTKYEDETLTETQAKEIYDQFNVNLGKIAMNAADLSKEVEKKLTKSPVSKTRPVASSNNQQQIMDRTRSLWSYNDDDDDDDELEDPRVEQKEIKVESVIIPTQTKANKSTKETDKNKSSKQNEQNSKQSLAASGKERTATIDQINVKSASKGSFATPAPPAPVVVKKKPAENSFDFLRPKKERDAMYSGKRIIRTKVPSLQELAIEAMKENIESLSHKHFHLLPYEVVKPVIEIATPQQLNNILYNNPDYADDVEPIWKQFCETYYKGCQREECESYYELYCRKFNEQEEKLLQITKSVKKRAEAVDHGRQTQKIAFPTRFTNGKNLVNSNIRPTAVSRIMVDLPSQKRPFSKGSGPNSSSMKKPKMTPLLKKTVKLFNGKP